MATSCRFESGHRHQNMGYPNGVSHIFMPVDSNPSNCNADERCRRGWCAAQRIKNINDCRWQSYCNSLTEANIYFAPLWEQNANRVRGATQPPPMAEPREGSEWQRSTKSRKSASPKILSGTATGHRCRYLLFSHVLTIIGRLPRACGPRNDGRVTMWVAPPQRGFFLHFWLYVGIMAARGEENGYSIS